MRESVLTTVKVVLAAAALGFAAFSMTTKPADAFEQSDVRHSCYAGCCGSCSGGLCCWGDIINPTIR